MRVLHLDSGRGMRGGQWQALRLLEGLQDAGIESILLARARSPLLARAREKGFCVEEWSLRAALRLARRCDLIHAHDARSHTLAALASRRPLIVARRVAFPIRSYWKYNRAECYIAVSNHVRSVLLEGGIPPERIFVVYDGVPLLKPAHGTEVLAPENAADPRKGAALALEAAALAGVPLRLTTDLEHDLPNAALFVYVTYSEGLGSAALLAMSAAVPVIASNIGGLREIVRHRADGLLVENSAFHIAEAIRELRSNPSLAREFGQRARQSIAEHFTCERMVRQTIEIYRQVLA
ncbi:MAG TPA: glycosyltransferase family 4 protein [Bryobacteraceae bacterium]|nr:glycosyltransferase family 4 protein [Bryobacteraceae bacterium]